MKRIIEADRSVIVAADVPTLDDLLRLSEAVKGVPGISAIKLGIILGLQGLKTAVEYVKHHLPDKPVIFDMQKAGNDIPDLGKGFAKVVRDAGVDAVILFPFTGPATQEAWTKACLDAGLQVMSGGEMTHEKFLKKDGGYIADDSPERMYRFACDLGVREFVLPGTKLEAVKYYRSIIADKLGSESFALASPGLITQGGDITECGQAAGKRWHAIVGRAISEQPTMGMQRRAAFAATSKVISVAS